jgi:two-component system response regulator NreC
VRPIRVHIADDHAVLRAGLRLLIQSQADMEVVGESGEVEETLVALKETPPDVLTLDLSMPGGGGVSLLKRLAAECPAVRVVVLTMHDEAEYFRAAIAAGAAGYVVKKSADSELLTAIRTVAQGRAYANCEIAPSSASPHSKRQEQLAELSQREREVLEFVAQGHTNAAIADRLSLSVKTVESYRARLMAKLGLQTRADLTQFALESGLLAPRT